MGAEVVGASEALRAEGALEGSRVLLNTLGVSIVGAHGLILGVRETQDIFSVG
jgi:voltage-gated potassium channel Kch